MTGAETGWTALLTRRPPSASAAGADDRLDDSLLAQLLVGDLVGHPAPGDDEHAVAETGELERIARLDDHRHAVSRLVPEGLVDVESRGDVDALRGLVGENHPDLATQKCPAQCDLLLVAAREEPNGLLDRRSPHLQPPRELRHRMAFRPAPDPTCGREASEHLDRHVAPHAEHGEQRLPDSIAAEEDDAGLEGCVWSLEIDLLAETAHRTGRPVDPSEAAQELELPVPFSAREADDFALEQREVDRTEPWSVKSGYVQQRLGPAVVAPLRERELERSPDHQRDEAVLRYLGGVVGALALPVAEHRDAVGDLQNLR